MTQPTRGLNHVEVGDTESRSHSSDVSLPTELFTPSSAHRAVFLWVARDVLTVDFNVCGIHCMGLNGRPTLPLTKSSSFQIATQVQADTDPYWNAIVGNGGTESASGWRKNKSDLDWQISLKILTKGMAIGATDFPAMVVMAIIDLATIEACRSVFDSRLVRAQRMFTADVAPGVLG